MCVARSVIGREEKSSSSAIITCRRVFQGVIVGERGSEAKLGDFQSFFFWCRNGSNGVDVCICWLYELFECCLRRAVNEGVGFLRR